MIKTRASQNLVVVRRTQKINRKGRACWGELGSSPVPGEGVLRRRHLGRAEGCEGETASIYGQCVPHEGTPCKGPEAVGTAKRLVWLGAQRL